MHTGKNYSGYALTYMGYDYLALKTFIKRGTIKKVICQIGVGKESDIYICEAGKGYDDLNAELEENKTEGEEAMKIEPGDSVVIKFARLGRTSFRTVKNSRDYLKGRSASWLYMSRIASLKEYAFMKALYNRGFPVPVPIDSNRHGIVMSLVKAYPMLSVKSLGDPEKCYHELIDIIIRLAEHGLVHGDFNEFNLMVSEEEEITVIDFP
jgi:RIO kinase 2